MRRLAGGLLAIMLAGCASPEGGRPQADQDRDGKKMAAALQNADAQGVGFNLEETLVLSGGEVPSGKEYRIHATVQNGVLRGGAARFTYRIDQGKNRVEFDMVIADGRLFSKARGAAVWKSVPVDSATALLPALRLQLIRETVLLASQVSGYSLTRVSAGFAHQYRVQPASDQLEQLESIPVRGRSEAVFLRTARGSLEVFLTVPGDRLARVEVHVTGTDPDNGTRQRIDNAIDIHPSRVDPIRAPERAVPVSPGEILS